MVYVYRERYGHIYRIWFGPLCYVGLSQAKDVEVSGCAMAEAPCRRDSNPCAVLRGRDWRDALLRRHGHRRGGRPRGSHL